MGICCLQISDARFNISGWLRIRFPTCTMRYFEVCEIRCKVTGSLLPVRTIKTIRIRCKVTGSILPVRTIKTIKRILGKWPTWYTFFSMYLFQFSTCFKQPRAHHQENQMYQYSYNFWYMLLCVGDRFVCRSERNFPTCTRNSHLYRVTYNRGCIDTFDSTDDEHGVARNMYRIEINT
jgi:hypothetical protein